MTVSMHKNDSPPTKRLKATLTPVKIKLWNWSKMFLNFLSNSPQIFSEFQAFRSVFNLTEVYRTEAGVRIPLATQVYKHSHYDPGLASEILVLAV